jgi:hypothetical protein
MNYQKLYTDIMNIDTKIRLVTICDINGKVMFSDHRQGVKNLLSTEESKESLELAINSWKIRSKLAPKIGKGKYVLAEYEKIKRITMPLGDNHLLYVTTEPEADHQNVIKILYCTIYLSVILFLIHLDLTYLCYYIVDKNEREDLGFIL